MPQSARLKHNSEMSPWVRSIFLPAFAFLLALPFSAWSDERCGEKQRNSPTYKAFETCANNRLIAAAEKVARTNFTWAPLGSAQVCSILEPLLLDGQHQQICRDPNGYACRHKGQLMDSKCNIDILDSADAVNTPTAVSAVCELEAKWAVYKSEKYPAFHDTQCSKGISEEDCARLFNSRNQTQYRELERAITYTPERVDKLKRLYHRVKDTYLKLISESKTIPVETKPFLLQKVKNTELWLDIVSRDAFLKDLFSSDCYNSLPGLPPNTSVYNSGGVIHFCIGQIYNLENMNENLVMSILGHEISHSIDPCELEGDAYVGRVPGVDKAASANVAQKIFPTTIECLRGGTGSNGCTDALLHCTTERGIAERCMGSRDCLILATATPSCRSGSFDLTQDPSNAADFRHEGAQFDQIGESFSDFMGGEVLARIIKDAQNSSAPGPQDKEDALVSIASEYARIHGTCLTSNTLDEHPPGFLRMNRVMMSSRELRTALGCPANTPPQTPGGNTTCQGL